MSAKLCLEGIYIFEEFCFSLLTFPAKFNLDIHLFCLSCVCWTVLQNMLGWLNVPMKYCLTLNCRESQIYQHRLFPQQFFTCCYQLTMFLGSPSNWAIAQKYYITPIYSFYPIGHSQNQHPRIHSKLKLALPQKFTHMSLFHVSILTLFLQVRNASVLVLLAVA